MKMTRTKGLWLVAALAVLWGSYWCYENFTIEEIRYPSSLKGEAVRNNLFAAERFAQAMGADARSTFGFRQLPAGRPASSVLILPSQRRTLLPRQRQDLLHWVESGGHLIVVTYTLEGESEKPDELLRALDVRQYYTSMGRRTAPPKAGEEEKAADTEDAQKAAIRRRQEMARRLEQYGPPRALLQLDRKDCPDQVESGSLAPRFPVVDAPLRVCFDPRFRLDTSAEKLWAVSSVYGIHALTVGRGAGRVTVLTDYEFMRNPKIGHGDHADMFAAMLGFNDKANPPKSVLLIPSEDVDGIFMLTWKYAWPVVLILAAWLSLALWRAGLRFGPLLPVRVLARRSLAEHVRASGEFLWRHGELAQLWRATLASTQRQIERVLPAAAYASSEMHMKALAQRSGIAVAPLESALNARYPPAAEKFPNTIATLDQLRKSL